MTTGVYSVVGMSCSNCKNTVEKTILSLNGVKSCSVNLVAENANIEYDESVISLSEIALSVHKNGFEIIVPKVIENTDKKTETKEVSDYLNKQKKHSLYQYIVLSISVLFTVISMVLHFAFHIHSKVLFIPLSLLLYALSYKIFYKGLIVAFKTLSFNMDTLISIGCIASLFSDDVHSGIMIITFASVGKFIESKAFSDASFKINSLLNLKDDKAKVVTGESITVVSSSDLKLSDTVILEKGDKIPADCRVINGFLEVDESTYTGESRSIIKKEGDTLISGTFVLKGEAKAECIRVGEDTSLSKLIALVNKTSEDKIPITSFVDKVSKIFVPVIIALSLLTFIVWFIITKNINISLSRFISVLVVSCPCALGLATPVALVLAVSKSSSEGILIKSASAIEKSYRVTDVFFDKTGTLTLSDVGAGGANTMRPDAEGVIKKLNSLKINTHLLTGDKKEIADNIALKLGIKNVHSDLKPDEKLTIVKESKTLKSTVMMAGDGVNDAAALIEADIGVSLSSASDISIESADVILVNNNLKQLLTLIKISKKAMTIIKENLFWALIYNVVMIPFSAGAFLSFTSFTTTPAISAFCMGLSSLFVVFNSLRLKHIKKDL